MTGICIGTGNSSYRGAAKINSYGRAWKAEGFRGAILYRRQEWFDAFDFSYDMSVPNVAHLDPQRGGCCTERRYFIGRRASCRSRPHKTIHCFTS